VKHRRADEATALYRLYDAAGSLLYLGISASPEARLQDHAVDKHWFHLVVTRSVEWYPSRLVALAAEAEATAAEKPLHDSSWRKSGSSPRPQWTNPEGLQRVVEGLSREIADGQHSRGAVLTTGAVAELYSVARVTASRALRVLAERGLVEFWYHGRFHVL